LNVREWLYVADCARGVMAVVEKGRSGEAYNISSGVHRCNIDVVKAILKALGRPESLIQFVEDRPGHDFRYSISCAKAQQEFGWKPQVDFQKGLSQTVDWYVTNRAWLELKVKYLRDYWSQVYKAGKGKA
jgi:dTDP-glucose 4,6-dehydratase